MKMSYTPPVATPNYMTSDWGSSKTKETALKIDHIADKAQFAIEMLESALRGFDTIEKEIVDISNATQMPSREQIRAFAYRVDTHQKQVQDGLERLKQMMRDVDRATDNIQAVKTSW
jgi:hypothetical protein